MSFDFRYSSSFTLSVLALTSTISLGARRYLTIFFGYAFSRRDVFPQAAARGASTVVLDLALPALIFSSIVPAFTSENISAIGPLALLAVVYILIGLLGGMVIREVCYVPRNFWQGIVIASGLSNWSSLRMYRFMPSDTTRTDVDPGSFQLLQ